MSSPQKELILYETRMGECPFEAGSGKARYIIRSKLDRLRCDYGHAGKCKSVGKSVLELKL